MKTDISYRSVAKVLGELLIVEGLVLLLPLVLALVDHERSWIGFTISSVSALVVGFLLRISNRGRPVTIRRREGFLLVSLSWIVFSLIGMIPYTMAVVPLSVSDAFFETVSGFTTTGATTIADVEVLTKALLLWRSMTQWIGGLGIILFMLALLPQLNEKGGIPMFNAETTGITHDKLYPRIRQTASTLWLVYIVLSSILCALLWVGPMDFFDSVCHAMTAMSTGGFSTKNASLAYWNSDYLSVVLTIFMFLGGVNFGLIYGLCRGRVKELFRNDVFKAYALIVGCAYIGTASALLIEGKAHGVSELLVQPMFHIVSDITTTGFSLADFSHWGPFCLMITMILMVIGGCAGSTSGAVKVDRIVALNRNLLNQIKLSLYPKRIMTVRVNGSVVSETEMARVMAFISIYLLLTLIGTLLLTVNGLEVLDSFFATLSCIGNNGLGYGITGAAGGYHMLPEASKWVMSFLMLAGRLELFSMLVILFPIFWRR